MNLRCFCCLFAAFTVSILASAAELSWPPGQAIPKFSAPAETLDAIEVQSLSEDELLMFSSLQGHVNATVPRILLLDGRAEEGRDTWADTSTVGLSNRQLFDRQQRFDLLKKYVAEIRGVVLYDSDKSLHYRNLAGTIAGLEGAIPVSVELCRQLHSHELTLPVVRDLTELPMTTGPEIYQYLYDNDWQRCTRRLIVSADPGRQGDLHHTRDIASAVGAAVVWLDNRDENQRDILRQFFADMTPGDAIVLGWYTTERSGITTASEFGVGTVPADFYLSASVYGSGDQPIAMPTIPKRSQLQNKTYITLFISDGDNIQYNQHAMRNGWDRSRSVRETLPLNWTISPSLVDIGPGLMNYYYQTATPNDCFVTGPSGMGYMMPVNTLNELGAAAGVYTKTPEAMTGYARMTQRYLQRSGLRVVTIWDNLTEWQREIYARECPDLDGVTVQNFLDDPTVRSSVVDGHLRFERLAIAYCTTAVHLTGSIHKDFARRNREMPQFLAYQVNAWKELSPHRLDEIAKQLKDRLGEEIEFVRADHFFDLQRESLGLPHRLTMSSSTQIHGVEESITDLQRLIDGSASTGVEIASEQTIEFEFEYPKILDRFRWQTKSPGRLTLAVHASSDGEDWFACVPSTEDDQSKERFDLVSRPAKFVRVVVRPIEKATLGTINEIEIYAK